jgi:hypothetical protein
VAVSKNNNKTGERLAIANRDNGGNPPARS